MVDLKPGMIFFWNEPTGLLGKLITKYNMRTFGRSDTTHCGLIAEVRYSNKSPTFILIYEAGSSGFQSREVPIKWFDQPNVKVGECKQSIKGVLEACKKYEGIGYGWFDLFLILVKHLTGLSMSLTREKRLICSEAVCRVLYDCSRSVDFQAEYLMPFDLITPQHIFLSKQVKILN